MITDISTCILQICTVSLQTRDHCYHASAIPGHRYTFPIITEIPLPPPSFLSRRLLHTHAHSTRPTLFNITAFNFKRSIGSIETQPPKFPFWGLMPTRLLFGLGTPNTRGPYKYVRFHSKPVITATMLAQPLVSDILFQSSRKYLFPHLPSLADDSYTRMRTQPSWSVVRNADH
jgi:hypothetical protein